MTPLDHRLLAAALDPGPVPTLDAPAGTRWGRVLTLAALVLAALALIGQC